MTVMVCLFSTTEATNFLAYQLNDHLKTHHMYYGGHKPGSVLRLSAHPFPPSAHGGSPGCFRKINNEQTNYTQTTPNCSSKDNLTHIRESLKHFQDGISTSMPSIELPCHFSRAANLTVLRSVSSHSNRFKELISQLYQVLSNSLDL